jgi:formylglycine-generating enzyme
MVAIPPGRVTLSDRRTQSSWSVAVADVDVRGAVHFCNALSRCEGLTPAYHLRTDAETAEWDSSADG